MNEPGEAPDLKSTETFRANLHRLAKALEISDPKPIAAALAFKGESARWLKRIWNSGISRPDPRRIKELRALAGFFNQEDVNVFWHPQAKVRPLSEGAIRRTQTLDQIAMIISAYVKLQRVRRRSLSFYRELIEPFGNSEEAFIEEFLGWNSDPEVPASYDDRNMLRFKLGESLSNNLADDKDGFSWRAWNNEYDDAVYRSVLERFSRHPGWQKFIRNAEAAVRQRFNIPNQLSESDDWFEWYKDECLKEYVSRTLFRIGVRIPSTEEVMQRFQAEFLEDPSSTLVSESTLGVMLEELQTHPRWTNWIKLWRNDIQLAERAVAKLWQKFAGMYADVFSDRRVHAQSFLAYMTGAFDNWSDFDELPHYLDRYSESLEQE